MQKITTSVMFAQNADHLSEVIAILRPFCRHFKWDLNISDAEYMENNLLEFKGIGSVFHFLGLADLDDSSVIGWRAKPEFFEIVTRAQGRNRGADISEGDAIGRSPADRTPRSLR
jgi:hypothetical protein